MSDGGRDAVMVAVGAVAGRCARMRTHSAVVAVTVQWSGSVECDLSMQSLWPPARHHLKSKSSKQNGRERWRAET